MPFGSQQIGQHLQVEGGGDDEEDAVAADADHVGVAEHHVRGHGGVGHGDDHGRRQIGVLVCHDEDADRRRASGFSWADGVASRGYHGGKLSQRSCTVWLSGTPKDS